jgi:protein-S-isoprenylcysteine O-methyltransferase Ste14
LFSFRKKKKKKDITMKLFLVSLLLVQVTAFLPVQQHSSRRLTVKRFLDEDDQSSTRPLSPPAKDAEEQDMLSRIKGFDVKSIDLSNIQGSFESVKDSVMGGDLELKGEVTTIAQFVLFFFVIIGGIPLVGAPLAMVAGPALLLAGIAVIVLGVNDMGAALTPLTVPTGDGLVTDGLFGKVRHPLYAGVIAACIGLSICTSSVDRLALTGLLWYVLDIKTDKEEVELDKMFPEYKDYKQTVQGKFVPHDLVEILPWNK